MGSPPGDTIWLGFSAACGQQRVVVSFRRAAARENLPLCVSFEGEKKGVTNTAAVYTPPGCADIVLWISLGFAVDIGGDCGAIYHVCGLIEPIAFLGPVQCMYILATMAAAVAAVAADAAAADVCCRNELGCLCQSNLSPSHLYSWGENNAHKTALCCLYDIMLLH